MQNCRGMAPDAPNIVIFGETGAGKSSIINLIAGRPSALTSNKAVGCTFEHQFYEVTVQGVECRLWDTTGLDEGTEGTVPAATAENNLKGLIRGLARTGGINLIIYCFRAGRLRKSFRRNYDIFYSGICRTKVPIALVVTGLEHHENGMENWWDTEGGVLQRLGMRFDAHACVTTLDTQDQGIQQRRLDSQTRLRDLVVTYSAYPPWRIGESFMSQIFPAFLSLMRPTPAPAAESIRTVIVYDMTGKDPTECPPGVAISWQRYTCIIGGHQYEFIRTDKRIWNEPAGLQDVGGLLIFYTSPLVDTGISEEDVNILKKFYEAAGGLTCPMIVVLRGCHDEGIARACWEAVAPSLDISVHLTLLPDAPDDRRSGQTELMTMMERLWTNPLGKHFGNSRVGK